MAVELVIMMSKALIVIFCIILFYIIFIVYSDFDDFLNSISQFRLEYLVLALGLIFVGMLISGVRQHFLFLSSGISIPIKQSILLYLAGHSMEVTPGGSGKIIKSYYLEKKFGYDISKSFPSVVVERFLDLMAVTTITIITLFYIHFIEVFIIVFFVVILILILYFLMRSHSFFIFIEKIFSKIPIFKKYINSIYQSKEIFFSLSAPRNILKNYSLSLISNSLYAISAYLIFLGFDVDLGIILSTFITFSSTLFGVLTLLPAGIGVTEISMVSFMTNFGITLSLATSIMIMLRLPVLLFLTCIGFITTKLFLK